MESPQNRTVAVIGAGLVGALAASMLAQRGWNVDLLEARADPRHTPPSSRARSINLALSPRGIEALRSVDPRLAETVKSEGVKMRGRMIHTPAKAKGQTHTEAQDYGRYHEGEYISSISRGLLSIYLLDHLDRLQHDKPVGRGNVTVHFNYKLKGMNMRIAQGVDLTFDTLTKGEQLLHFDFIIGGDGSYSKVRKEMMRGTRFNFTQNYARHAYLELSIPTGPNDTFSISPEHLHIWPRGEFMLIALPNQDKSFTLTLFAYDTTFQEIAAQLAAGVTPNPVVELFKKEFPDALELMGEEGLLKNWNDNPKDGLITIECSPYHYEDRALLIGDAAHAMVPFYGQGMNCAFEDVRVLSTVLDHFSASPNPVASVPLPFSSLTPSLASLAEPKLSPLGQALAAYTEIRTPSLLAIQKLAGDNYAEMASSVVDPFYLLRLSLDGVLSKLFETFGTKKGGGQGGGWESLYRMVTFRYGLAYEEALARRAWQSKVLTYVGGVGLSAVIGATVWATKVSMKGRHLTFASFLAFLS